MNQYLKFSYLLKLGLYIYLPPLFQANILSWNILFWTILCPREINGKKEVYKEKYIFVHDSLPVWCIHESYWKYVPWNQRKQYAYTKNVPPKFPNKEKCLIKMCVDSWLVPILKQKRKSVSL